MSEPRGAFRKKRLRILAALSGLLLLAGLAIYLAPPAEPSYQGRKLSELIADYDKGPGFIGIGVTNVGADPEVARSMVRKIGTNAIPMLLNWLKAKDYPVKLKLNQVFEKHSLIHFRFQTAEEKHSMAASGFGMLGEKAEPAAPALVDLLQADAIVQRQWATEALQAILLWDHEKTVWLPLLLPLVSNGSDQDIQARAAFCLHFGFPIEAEKAGVYKMFPKWKNWGTNVLGSSSTSGK